MVKPLGNHLFLGCSLPFNQTFNSGSLRWDVLSPLGLGLCKLILFHVNVTGAWSLILTGWIFEYEILDMIELLV